MSKFLNGIKGKEKKEITSFDADAIAEKLHSVSVGINIPAVNLIETQTPAAAKQKAGRTAIPEEDKEEVHRLTLDIPQDIMDQMRKDTKRRGQTIKGFIVSLIYDFYDKSL
jgi:hypothetical protein